MANADYEGRLINQKIIEFCKNNKNSHYFSSLGQKKYLSCLKYVDAVIGNSSSGLIEVPSFKKGTIDIGNRQKGRYRFGPVIDVTNESKNISEALGNIFNSYKYQKFENFNFSEIYKGKSPSSKIIEILKCSF